MFALTQVSITNTQPGGMSASDIVLDGKIENPIGRTYIKNERGNILADNGSMLGIERQKQLVGCGEDSSSCMAELSGALNARYVLGGSVSRFGDALQLNLPLFDNPTNLVVPDYEFTSPTSVLIG